MTMSVFEFEDYKLFVRQRIEEMPRRGRGEMGRMAAHLRMHPTRVSQILNGEIHLSAEQACSLCAFLGLSAAESDFFTTLVQLARAGSKDLEAMLHRQLDHLRERAKQLVHRVPREKILTEEQKAIFYSSWSYSGIRLATSIESLGTIDALAEHFQISREKVRLVVDFLLETGLCVEAEGGNGKLKMGAKTTHLEQSSPLVLRHHANWRIKGLAGHESLGKDELAYTCPVSLRKEDVAVIREMLSQLIQQFLQKVIASDPPDTLACLCIDWFEVKR